MLEGLINGKVRWIELENKMNGSGDAHILRSMALSKTEPEIATTDRRPRQK